MKGVVSSIDLDDASLVRKAKASPGLVGRDLVREVIPTEPAPGMPACQAVGKAAGWRQTRRSTGRTFTSSRSTTA